MGRTDADLSWGRRVVVAPRLHTSRMGSKPEQIEPVDDPGQPRDDDTARERSTSPVPRVGDTWEDMTDHGTNGPQRRVGVLAIEGDQALVQNKVTRRNSHVALDRFVPPHWRFIG